MRVRNIVIVMARCCRGAQGFGLRFERRSDIQWLATWAFPVRIGLAEREGYDRSQISGAIQTASTYPGCPHCGNRSFFRCGACGKVACWDGESRSVTCPWCGNGGELSGMIKSLEGGTDS